MKLLPCPFCQGPPCLTAHLRSGKIFEGRKRYPSEGLDLYANIWCHECGAQGPREDGFMSSDEDVEALKIIAAQLWNRRDDRHRSLYDDGMAKYPRSDAATQP